MRYVNHYKFIVKHLNNCSKTNINSLSICNDQVLTIEKRVQVPQYQTNTQSQTHTNVQSGWNQQPAAGGFDIRKFFDFNFSANSGFGGPHTQQQPQQTVPQQPQIVYEERVVPKVVYEKRIVPQVVVEKKIVPETVLVPKAVQPAPATTTFTKQVNNAAEKYFLYC